MNTNQQPTQSSPSETILQEAARIVDGARRDDYGHPSINHARTAAIWSAYLGVSITPRQVCWLNILQKASRDAHANKRDNLVDAAGWARNAEMCDEAQEGRKTDVNGLGRLLSAYNDAANAWAVPVKHADYDSPLKDKP